MRFLIAVICVLSLAGCASQIASTGNQEAEKWLSEYYRRLGQFRREQCAYIEEKYPEWKEDLRRWTRVHEAGDALDRYLFGYYLVHKPEQMEWCDGEWTHSTFVCNCGEEGSVPTVEFRRLFKIRCQADYELETYSPPDTYQRISAALHANPSFTSEAFRKRVADMREDFQSLKNRPNLK